MRKALLASASALALSCSAAEAAPPVSWTGFYVGANAGYGWGSTSPVQIFDLGPVPAGAPPNYHPNGFIGGGQAGYNWQTGMWVFGGEVDFSGLGVRGDSSLSPFFGGKGFANTGTFSSRYDWLFTARLRGGFLVTPTWLIYVTGGLAVTQVRDSATVQIPETWTWTQTSTLTGGTIGGGIETMFGPNWTARLEYLYARFKDTAPPGVIVDGPAAGTALDPTFSFNHNLNVIRFAFNYKFGS